MHVDVHAHETLHIHPYSGRFSYLGELLFNIRMCMELKEHSAPFALWRSQQNRSLVHASAALAERHAAPMDYSSPSKGRI